MSMIETIDKNPVLNKIGFTQSEIDKIGNTIIYFANHIKSLSKTKILKIIYLLDETSVKQYGIPFLNLQYKVWQLGPVNTDIYSDLSPEHTLLKDFIKLNFKKTGECYIEPKKKFHDDEFSQIELQLLDTVIKKYGHLSARELIKICHRPSTIWYKIAKENGLLESFRKRHKNTSDYYIDLSQHLSTDKHKTELYNSHRDFLDIVKGYGK